MQMFASVISSCFEPPSDTQPFQERMTFLDTKDTFHFTELAAQNGHFADGIPQFEGLIIR